MEGALGKAPGPPGLEIIRLWLTIAARVMGITAE